MSYASHKQVYLGSVFKINYVLDFLSEFYHFHLMNDQRMELTDEQWNTVKKLFPAETGGRGKPAVEIPQDATVGLPHLENLQSTEVLRIGFSQTFEHRQQWFQFAGVVLVT